MHTACIYLVFDKKLCAGSGAAAAIVFWLAVGRARVSSVHLVLGEEVDELH